MAAKSALVAITTIVAFALAGVQQHAAPVSAPVSAAVAADESNWTDRQFEQHIADLKSSLPDESFNIVLQKPFVVIGNSPTSEVRSRAVGTVKWAVDRLKQDYFEKDPVEIINIWLFKDRETYEKYNRQLFGRAPHTPFGYYSPAHRALVMNIATGGGTLVHEIVHPFIEANFPQCPSWFNEGLASLYEQSRDHQGRIWGLTNWRLAGLQQAIQDGDLPSFEELCGTSRDEFYNSDRGSNYAQARYLCYYLQEQGLLKKFYDQFREDVDTDPTGYRTLAKVLGQPDMETFQTEWERFVLRLRFR